MNSKAKITGKSAKDIVRKHTQVRNYAVRDLITPGITMVCSPPKYGKSWLMLDLALSVSTGAPFLGMETKQSGVLYLALEDSEQRLSSRLSSVLCGKDVPDALYFATDFCGTIGNGFTEALSEFLNGTPGIGLIIIDTLQKVRGSTHGNESAYGYDYREMAAIKKIADDRGICCVLVHHTSKDARAVGLARVSGTAGLTGAADAVIVLSRIRGTETTLMSITGRDVTERGLILKMDWSRYRWELVGSEKEIAERNAIKEFYDDPIVKTIIAKIERLEEIVEATGTFVVPTQTFTSSSLLQAVEEKYGKQNLSIIAVGKKLKAYEDLFMTQEHIRYEQVRSGASRDHIFTRTKK